MSRIADAVPPGEDAPTRKQRDLERSLQEQSAARSMEASSIGNGGTLRVDGSLVVTGSLTVPAGSLSSAVDMHADNDVTAGRNVTAGQDVQAARDVLVGRNVAASGIITGASMSTGGTLNVTGASFFPEALANPVTAGYFAAYINGDARLGRTVSSRRYKQNIAAWNPDVQAVFALQLVTFRQKTAVRDLGDKAPLEYGLIAEELVDLGLNWLVLFIDGKPEGIAYEKLALALLPVVQDHERRMLNIEKRLDAAGL